MCAAPEKPIRDDEVGLLMKTKSLFVLVIMAMCIIAAPGCQRRQAGAPPGVAPAPPAFGAAPTEAECREFGKQLEAAAHERDAQKMARLLRVGEIAERSIQDLDLNSSFRQGAIAGI